MDDAQNKQKKYMFIQAHKIYMYLNWENSILLSELLTMSLSEKALLPVHQGEVN